VRKNFIYFALFLFLASCKYPDINKAEDLSKKILVSIQNNNWDFVREISSASYKNKLSVQKPDQLKNMVLNEYGKIRSFKKLLLYTGSSFIIPGENYVKISYDVIYTKGNGRIEMIFILENDSLKLMNIDFIKKSD
jgi:hypothetical protein